jgi:hypothetical protein
MRSIYKLNVIVLILVLQAVLGSAVAYSDDNDLWSKLSNLQKISYVRGLIDASNYIAMDNTKALSKDFNFDDSKKFCLDLYWSDDSNAKIYSKSDVVKHIDCIKYLSNRTLNRYKIEINDIDRTVDIANDIIDKNKQIKVIDVARPVLWTQDKLYAAFL